MKTYLISFYYGTDCRTEFKADAVNELVALGMALNELGADSWIDDGEWTIKIKLIES